MSHRRLEAGRLVYYGDEPNAAYWAHHWRTYGHRSSSAEGSAGKLVQTLQRYLPRDGKIIEAGCGSGQIVASLLRVGYDVEGIEWSQDTVRQIHDATASLPVRVGDATAIDVPDGHYKAYVSLGVVEHRKDGPSPFLHEAFRVLSDDGVALISVPSLNVVRRAKGRLGAYRSPGGTSHHPFYQYAFHPREFREILAAHGFDVIAQHPQGVMNGLQEEFPWFRTFLSVARPLVRRIARTRRRSAPTPVPEMPALRNTVGSKLDRLVERRPFTLSAHTMLYVCTKSESKG